jgi:hypothetical protein
MGDSIYDNTMLDKIGKVGFQFYERDMNIKIMN